MDFEKELEQLSRRYTAEGYAVVVHPQEDQLPPFAKDFGADIIATRGEERVLVQVKEDRAALEADPNIPLRAEVTNAQPGWQYDLVILNEGDPLRRWTRGSREPSEEEIDEALAYVERMTDSGDLRAASVQPNSTTGRARRQQKGESFGQFCLRQVNGDEGLVMVQGKMDLVSAVSGSNGARRDVADEETGAIKGLSNFLGPLVPRIDSLVVPDVNSQSH